MIFGITGGTGCGKTTLLSLIEQAGGVVLDCDAIYHELLRKDKTLLATIDARFPGVVEDGALQRKKLGTIVFSDPTALKDLNTITHKAVKQAVVEKLSEKPSLAAIDAIALFEGGLVELCDVTVAITAPEEMRIQRLMARDGIDESYARSRIAAQHSEDWFRHRCDRWLTNDADRETFLEKCVAFLQEYGIMV